MPFCLERKGKSDRQQKQEKPFLLIQKIRLLLSFCIHIPTFGIPAWEKAASPCIPAGFPAAPGASILRLPSTTKKTTQPLCPLQAEGLRTIIIYPRKGATLITASPEPFPWAWP